MGNRSLYKYCSIVRFGDKDMPAGSIVPSNPSTWPKPDFSGSSAITVFLVILTGSFSLGQIIPSFTALVKVGEKWAGKKYLRAGLAVTCNEQT